MTDININPESELGFILSKIAERLERIAIGIEQINKNGISTYSQVMEL